MLLYRANHLLKILAVSAITFGVLTPGAAMAGKSRAEKQTPDSVMTYWITPITVTAERTYIGASLVPLEKDNLSRVLERSGFKLIRKGVFFAQDVYADGLKRGDINVVVDGERYHSACPNRMDSPLTRVNPMEMESVELIKTGGSVQSGLGGVVSFRRRAPAETFAASAGASAAGGAKRSVDAIGAAEGRNHRASVRYSAGDPYTDAEDRTFEDLYGYEANFPYMLVEGNLAGTAGRLGYGANLAYTEDVSFPYLMMDERKNEVYNGSLEIGDHKVYANYTDHRMDNDMRVSNMLMETFANNVTVGVVGEYYEAFYRNWDANNEFVMMSGDIQNHMIPDTRTLSASLHKAFTPERWLLSVRLGAVYHRVGDESRLAFYQPLYPGSDKDTWFPTYAVGVSYVRPFQSNWMAGVMLESASESPEMETLFIAVQKPMGKPWWSGNPTLDQPVRATLRGSLRYRRVQLEMYGTYISNYVYLEKAQVGTVNYMTYGNIDAALAGANLNVDWRYLAVQATYTYAEDQTSNTPLAEIAPFSLSAIVRTPRYGGLEGFAGYAYNDAQTRVDNSLDERATPAWHRLDLGVEYTYRGFLASFEVANVTNELFYQHLSYLRNPFASGLPVWEPGTAVTLGLRFGV